MSNLKQDTGKPRFLKLLFVVLMMSVGLNLLLGCGKNKGQVVGPQPTCQKPDCDEGKKPFSGDLWETAMGVVNYPGYGFEPGMYIQLGLDLYLSGGAGTQAIVPNPVGGEVEAEGSLFVDSLQLFCGMERIWTGPFFFDQPKFESVPAGEFKIVKNIRRGSATSNGFSGNLLELKKGDQTLKVELFNQSFLPSAGTLIQDPAGNTYDQFLFGQIKISNSNGCFATPWISSGGSTGYGPYNF